MMTRNEYAAALDRRARELRARNESPLTIQRWAGQKETDEWSSWVKYWTAIEARATLMLVADRKSFTVPAMHPWDFDVGYNG